MSAAQSPQEQLVTLEEQEFDWSPGRSIGCFTTLVVPVLIMLLALQSILNTTLVRLNLIAPLRGLNTLLAVVYGWGFASLCVCLLLYLWLKSKPAAIAVTLVLAILWAIGLARYVHVPPEVLSRVLTVLLALGILVVVALWFLRPLEGPDVWISSSGWLLIWAILVFILKEYAVGIVLLVSLLASGAVFLVGLYITCGFILPFPEKAHRRKAFDFLRDFALGWNFPAYVVVDELREEDKLKKRVPGDLYNYVAMGPGLVITDANHAVAISDGVKFKGVQGPGVVFTGYADRPRVIDLRPQSFAFPAEALTKDGIKVKTLAIVAFKIDARGRQPSLGESLPYNKGAAFKALHAEKVEHIGKGQSPERMKQRKWYELPSQIGERILQDILSQYDFDELYGPHQPGGAPPRRAISDAFAKRLTAELEPLGIQLIVGGVSDMEPADAQVYVERVHAWQAEWSRRIALTQAEGRVEWLRRVERARAEAQAELILNLGRQLEELSAARAEIRPEDALSLLMSVLDGLTNRESVGPLLPGETLQALMNIRRIISG
jgi:hypothetical protein